MSANERRAAEILYGLGYGPVEVSGIVDDVTRALDAAKKRGEERVLRWMRRVLPAGPEGSIDVVASYRATRRARRVGRGR